MKLLSPEELQGKKLASLRVAASTSFGEEEVAALAQLLATLQRDGDVRLMAKSKALARIAAKVPAMQAAIERQKERRAALAANRGR